MNVTQVKGKRNGKSFTTKDSQVLESYFASNPNLKNVQVYQLALQDTHFVENPRTYKSLKGHWERLHNPNNGVYLCKKCGKIRKGHICLQQNMKNLSVKKMNELRIALRKEQSKDQNKSHDDASKS